jgi:hypothetical protein
MFLRLLSIEDWESYVYLLGVGYSRGKHRTIRRLQKDYELNSNKFEPTEITARLIFSNIDTIDNN